MKKFASLQHPVIDVLEERLMYSATVDVVLVDGALADQDLLREAAHDADHYFVYNSNTDSAADVIANVTQWAQDTHQKIDSISIVSHGGTGFFELGNERIDTAAVASHADVWEQLGNALDKDANIYLYGCNTAQGGVGQSLIDAFADATHADVFASNDVTGAGGNWELESASHGDEAERDAGLASSLDKAMLANYQDTLANSVPGAQTTSANTNITFNSANGNLISVTNSTGGSQTVTLTATHGTLTLSGVSGLSFTAGDGSADTTMTFSGSTANINAALNNSVYAPTNGYIGSAQISITSQESAATAVYSFNTSVTGAEIGGALTNHNGATTVTDPTRGTVLQVEDVAASTSDKWVYLPSSTLSGDNTFTVSTWVNTTYSGYSATLPSSGSHLFGNYNMSGGTGDFGVSMDANGNIGLWAGGDGSGSFSTKDINDGNWHQITVTGTGSNIILYVDGVQIQSLSFSNALGSDSITFGARSTSDMTYVSTAKFDDIMIFDRSLSATEAQNLYNNDRVISGSGGSSPGVYDTDTIAITVNSNTAPVLGADTSASVAENTTAVGTYAATDANGDSIAYSLGGADAGKFTINSSGVLSFVTAPNYENPNSAAASNAYTVNVIATDTGGLFDTQVITVNVTNVNEASVVSGTFTGTINEGNIGDTTTATGSLSISDPDAGDNPSFANVGSTAGDNGYGSFVLNNGTWTYTLNQSAVQSLDVGDTVTDTHTFTATDGTTRAITITINGTEDASVVSGTFTGNVTEGNIGDTATASGTLSISDVDDTPSFTNVSSTAGDNGYGSFVLNNGTWTYTLNQSAVQSLDVGDTVTDTHTFTATDGTTQAITITINGTEDAPVVSGTFTGSVTEGNIGDTATATGTLSISDVDDTPSFANVSSTAGDNGYGSFVLNNGTWTYTLNQSAVQSLDVGDTVTDTHTFTATDGTTQTITITIAGAEDAPVVSGTFTGSVNEGNIGDTTTTTGTLSISDVDDVVSFADVATTAGDNGYGTFALTAGTWTYTLNQSAVQSLDVGDTVTDTHTFTATDGTTRAITITINGTEDAPVVSGTFTGNVTEGNIGDTATATGTLSISDVDDTPSFVNVSSTTGDNGYGSFVLNSGTWTYTLNQSAVQSLDVGDTVTDAHTFTATDGTTQTITITIAGTEDAPVVSGTFTGSVNEGNIGDTATATGTLSITDVDDVVNFADVATTAGDNGYGTFALTAGTWTYTLNQAAVQSLDTGDTVSDTYTFTATDGTTRAITVTINGTDDAAIVSGTFTGNVTEGNIGDTATATGTLSISDVDDTPSFANVSSTPGDNGYGSFVLNNGTWTYTLDQSAVQSLDVSDTVTDTHTFTATDGTTQTITITIAGTEDAAVVSGTFSGSVTEGNIGDTATATGSLSIADVDDTLTFADVASTAGDNGYGSFVLNNGTWTYTLNQPAVQSLDAGDTVTDTHTFTASDGTTQAITITITGTEDAAAVSGTFAGSVNEGNIGDTVTATGTLSISDVDDVVSFADVASTAGDNGYGNFVLTAGTWTYTLNQSSVQSLDIGDTVTDTHTFTATDGTTQTITITINGTEDAPVVSGTFTGSVNEGNIGDTATATGTLSISDVDDVVSFADVASTAGDNGYGNFVLASGTWTYTLNQSAVQSLDVGDTVTDTHTFTASDGTTQVVTITIAGAEDAAVVAGTFTAGVNEGNIGDTTTATGTLSISDVDDAVSFADVASTTGDNGYGSFVLTAGTWTYTLDQSAVQSLDVGDTVTDAHTFTASDGTTQVVTITITGTEDAPVVSGTFAGSVTEGNIGDTATATGTLTISDVDDVVSFADVTSTVGDNGYGSFVLSSGAWTYTLNQSAVQSLDVGDTVTDTHTFTASDGTTQTVTITISGSEDLPVVSGTFTGGVTEGNIGDTATALGALSISDVDDAVSFADVASTAGDNGYGSFALTAGTWTYTLNQSAVQSLDAGDTVADTHTFTASDGITQTITITITGTEDAPVISGTFTGNVTEGNLGDVATATGSLSIADVDDSVSFADVVATVGDNGYGSFVLSSGTWTYTLDQNAVQLLDQGDTVFDTHTFTATDGSTQTVTITIAGAADSSIVTGTATGSVTEGNSGDVATATGTLAIFNSGYAVSFPDVAATTGDNGYGSFAMTAGNWTYALDQNAVQSLDAGDTVTDRHTFTASDGTTQVITITISGTEDAAVVSGSFIGAVTEGNTGDTAIATGTLAINDVDDNVSFANVAAVAGDNAYGNFALNNGSWTYTLNQSTVQGLDAGQTVTDTHTFTATDGTTQTITIAITGTADFAVVSGAFTAAVTEGNIGDVAAASGALSISDADTVVGFANVAGVAGDNGYGSFALDSGTWTYTLNQAAVQSLNAGDTVIDTHTFVASDGTTQTISVTINGSNDAPTVSGTFAGVVTKGAATDVASVSGVLNISDPDNAVEFANVSSVAGDNGYGSFVLNDGTWTYRLNQSAVSSLAAGQTLTDSHTFIASDGTAQTVSVSINGADNAVASGSPSYGIPSEPIDLSGITPVIDSASIVGVVDTGNTPASNTSPGEDTRNASDDSDRDDDISLVLGDFLYRAEVVPAVVGLQDHIAHQSDALSMRHEAKAAELRDDKAPTVQQILLGDIASNFEFVKDVKSQVFFWERSDELKNDLREEQQQHENTELAFKSVGVVSLGLLLNMLLNGGKLAAALAATLPSWSSVDPVSVLANGKKTSKTKKQSEADDDGDKSEAMFERRKTG